MTDRDTEFESDLIQRKLSEQFVVRDVVIPYHIYERFLSDVSKFLYQNYDVGSKNFEVENKPELFDFFSDLVEKQVREALDNISYSHIFKNTTFINQVFAKEIKELRNDYYLRLEEEQARARQHLEHTIRLDAESKQRIAELAHASPFDYIKVDAEDRDKVEKILEALNLLK